ncbi:hypothetical protein RQM65_02095 [Pricia sp. S334]|uniref:Cytochrome C and Quinol oxidase polypeptide I n=1 Tax=Pricia mediterranea TaxID=3076079 RepID=A0ABU3L2G0_9FLAO|nr:hypothetical protein [Pricia sp. S334]MDT7827453.1 hypothetical protein [Pricia sp. S334]
MKSPKPHIKVALAYFLIAALLGVLLRSFPSIDIPFNYRYIVHTHSHIALLGWVYLALTTLIYKLFVQSSMTDWKYRRIFWATQLSLIGMLLTFPFTGYALFSIVFSTLFLFVSYWFFWFFKTHAKREFRKTNAYACIVAALWYLVISSLGPWALGGIMGTLGAESVWYRLAIYFYLHFLYNGWMIMALVGLFFYVLELRHIRMSLTNFRKFFWGINFGIVLSFFLSTLFAEPSVLLYLMGGAGAIFQLFAFILLARFLFPYRDRLRTMCSKWQWIFLGIVAVLLVIKMGLQLLTAFPYFSDLAATFLNFTVGYLHLTFLGVVTIALFFLLDYFGMMHISKIAFALYFMGFVVTEALIFYKGIAGWRGFPVFEAYYNALAVGSLLIPLSLIVVLFGPNNRDG